MKKYIFSLILLLFFQKIRAQEVQPSIEDKAQEPKVTTYYAQDSEKEVEATAVDLIKINLISVFSGDIGINYERKLLNKIAAEAGVGVTVKNISREGLIDFFEVEDASRSAKIKRTYKPGFSFTASVKYYPNDASKAFFFAPMFRYRHYNSEATIEAQRGVFKEAITLSDFLLTVGYVDYIQNAIFLEYFAGVGIRNRNQSLVSTTESGTIEPNKIIKMGPLISLGLKIGFQVKK